MKILLLLPLLLGLMSTAVAHNEANGGDSDIDHFAGYFAESEEGEVAEEAGR